MNKQKDNARCAICGNSYYMCLSCKDAMSVRPWQIHTDTAEHYKIFQIIKGFSTGVYTKEEAKNKLKNVDLSDLDTFKENQQEIIKGILKEEKVVETESEIIEEIPIVEKAIISRRRNYKVEVE